MILRNAVLISSFYIEQGLLYFLLSKAQCAGNSFVSMAHITFCGHLIGMVTAVTEVWCIFRFACFARTVTEGTGHHTCAFASWAITANIAVIVRRICIVICIII